MTHWLFKSEPFKFSWEMLKAKGEAGTEWDGVRNYQARNNMRAMVPGDLGFFYHSNLGKAVVGIVEVIAPVRPDPTTDDPRWDCVTIRAVRPLPQLGWTLLLASNRHCAPSADSTVPVWNSVEPGPRRRAYLSRPLPGMQQHKVAHSLIPALWCHKRASGFGAENDGLTARVVSGLCCGYDVSGKQ